MRNHARTAFAKLPLRGTLRASMVKILVGSVLTAACASAATYTWQIAGTTDTWSTAAGDTNWFIDAGVTLSPCADSNDAVFNAVTGEPVTLSGTLAPTTTSIGANNGSWTLSGHGQCERGHAHEKR